LTKENEKPLEGLFAQAHKSTGMANFEDVPDDFGSFGGGPAAPAQAQGPRYLHPIAVVFHLAFKVAALVVYLILTLLLSSVVSGRRFVSETRTCEQPHVATSARVVGSRRVCPEGWQSRSRLLAARLFRARFPFFAVFMELTLSSDSRTSSSSSLWWW
jgi:hypothetical protein